jgi:hypothetical protein
MMARWQVPSAIAEAEGFELEKRKKENEKRRCCDFLESFR